MVVLVVLAAVLGWPSSVAAQAGQSRKAEIEGALGERYRAGLGPAQLIVWK